MKACQSAGLALAFALGGSGLGGRAAAAQEPPRTGQPPGMAVYDKWCAGCHGVDGKGDGAAAAYMLPRPRDFTTGLYQIRTTPSGALPTDEDILEVIDEGMPGTAMPGWREHLSQDQRNDLVQVLKSFAPAFERREAPEPIAIGSPPGESEEGLARGREVYELIECWQCHGQAGRGDGASAPTLEDDDDLPVRAADLTENWLFNGGGTTEAIFTSLMTGLNGTPMPSFGDLIDAEVISEEDLWRLAQYVRSLAPEEPPRAREVVRAALVDTLPGSIEDPAWELAEEGYVPLVGQVIEAPRWFAPSVDGVFVRALHDGEELAILFAWHDPSESPDPDWAEWRTRVLAVMAPDGGTAESPAGTDTVNGGANGGAEEGLDEASEGPPNAPGAAVDALVVQFPPEIPEGMERPYFLMGGEDDPVYLWHWESGSEGAREAIGRGLAEIEALAGESALTWEAAFDQGEWRLLVRRALSAEGVETRLAFEPGRAIPIALFAWDGSNGESGTRGAISTWYFLYLDQPTTATVYVVPVLAMLLTAALGVVVVVRAQRRAGANGLRPTGAPGREDD